MSSCIAVNYLVSGAAKGSSRQAGGRRCLMLPSTAQQVRQRRSMQLLRQLLADPGQFCSSWHYPAKPVMMFHQLRAALQVAGAAIVAQPPPGAGLLPARRMPGSKDRGNAQKTIIIGQNADPRLLELRSLRSKPYMSWDQNAGELLAFLSYQFKSCAWMMPLKLKTALWGELTLKSST